MIMLHMQKALKEPWPHEGYQNWHYLWGGRCKNSRLEDEGKVYLLTSMFDLMRDTNFNGNIHWMCHIFHNYIIIPKGGGLKPTILCRVQSNSSPDIAHHQSNHSSGWWNNQKQPAVTQAIHKLDQKKWFSTLNVGGPSKQLHLHWVRVT